MSTLEELQQKRDIALTEYNEVIKAQKLSGIKNLTDIFTYGNKAQFTYNRWSKAYNANRKANAAIMEAT